MSFSRHIQMVEAGPREGLQSGSEFVPMKEKIRLINRPIAVGIRHVEATALMLPQAVSQMADAHAFVQGAVRSTGAGSPSWYRTRRARRTRPRNEGIRARPDAMRIIKTIVHHPGLDRAATSIAPSLAAAATRR